MDKNKVWHVLFLVGIFFKGFDGVMETIGGVVLLFLKHGTIANFVRMLFGRELTEEPPDVIVNWVMHFVSGITSATELFASVYLIFHGVIKVLLFLGLYRRKLWVYPLAEVVLALFVVYQLYRFSHTLSVLLLVLSILDILIISLVWREYRRLRGVPGKSEVV